MEWTECDGVPMVSASDYTPGVASFRTQVYAGYNKTGKSHLPERGSWVLFFEQTPSFLLTRSSTSSSARLGLS
jgi:hypothetical protein